VGIRHKGATPPCSLPGARASVIRPDRHGTASRSSLPPHACQLWNEDWSIGCGVPVGSSKQLLQRHLALHTCRAAYLMGTPPNPPHRRAPASGEQAASSWRVCCLRWAI